jgi:hypothetical protein
MLISGLGIVLAFAIQGLFSFGLSLFWLYRWDDAFGEVMSEQLDEVSDIQVMTGRVVELAGILVVLTSNIGLALLISGLVQHETLDLYHFHLLYDTVNFTA